MFATSPGLTRSIGVYGVARICATHSSSGRRFASAVVTTGSRAIAGTVLLGDAAPSAGAAVCDSVRVRGTPAQYTVT